MVRKKLIQYFVILFIYSIIFQMYLLTGTAGTKKKSFICDVILHFCSFQELSNIVQDSSPSETPPAVQIKWLLCDVISLNSSWKRQEIYFSCRKDPLLGGGIHQTQLLLANNFWCHSRVSYQCRKTEEDYLSTGMDISIKMKWVLCLVISLHRWWKRWEILSSCRSDPVFDGGIHKPLLLSKMKWFFCDVIPHSHLIGGRRNRTINPQERIIPLKSIDSSVM